MPAVIADPRKEKRPLRAASRFDRSASGNLLGHLRRDLYQLRASAEWVSNAEAARWLTLNEHEIPRATAPAIRSMEIGSGFRPSSRGAVAYGPIVLDLDRLADRGEPRAFIRLVIAASWQRWH
jgi:hypothetical protein